VVAVVAAAAGAPAEPRETVKHSRHGPILHEDGVNQRAYALQWIGSQPGGAAYLNALSVARAQNKAEFLQAIAAWRVPGLNFVYADVDKNIGWIAATHYPIRSADHSGLLPVPGKDGAVWKGYLSLRDYPQQFDSPRGQVVTANHNIVPTGYSHPIGNEFAPSYRFERLQALLNSQPQWKLAEFRALQQDSTSLPAISLVKLLQGAQLDAADQQAASILLAWDGNLSVDSPAGSLFAIWQRELQAALFQRQVSPEHGMILTTLTGTPAMLAALTTADPRWFGDKARAERDRLMREAFSRAVKHWQQLPSDQRSRWGALHKVKFRHPLTNFGPVAARLFNVGPFERPGDGNTPNNTRYDDQFQQIHGASYRQLFDLADWDLGLATSAPGQSGEPGSPHYRDLAKGWAQGEYFPLVYSRSKVAEVTRHKLRLVPTDN
jgi:penicillin amidase